MVINNFNLLAMPAHSLAEYGYVQMVGKWTKSIKTKYLINLAKAVYHLPIKEVQIPGTTIRTFEIGESPRLHKVIQHKVAMIMGATGTGKSTDTHEIRIFDLIW